MTLEEARKLKPGEPIWVKVKAKWKGGLDYIGYMHPWEVARLCKFNEKQTGCPRELRTPGSDRDSTIGVPDIDCFFYHFNAKPAGDGTLWVRAHVSWYNLSPLNEKGELGENNVDKNIDNKIRVCAYYGENIHKAGDYVHPRNIKRRPEGTVWSSELEGRHA